MGGFQGERATVKKKKSNIFLLLTSMFFMLISASHFLWADLIRERWMDQALLCADNVQQRKRVQLTPCEQLLCSPLPELLCLRESLEAAAVNRLEFLRDPWAPSLEKVSPDCCIDLCPLKDQSKARQGALALLTAQQEPLCAAFSSRWTNILKSDPFSHSREVRSSD